MRAVLIFNPSATSTDERVRDVIATALRSVVELEVVATKRRGHALHLAAGAVHEGVEAVFALGGDGTANEVIQALAGTDVLLGIIPGGGANVLARALGMPNDAVRAAGELLAHLRAGEERWITLGRAAGRYFAFNAGFGFDAAVVRHVEQHERLKRTGRQLAFVWSAAREWVGGAGRRRPTTSVELPGGRTIGGIAISLVGNTDPYTYLGSRPMHVHPEASFEAGLDLLTVEAVSTARLARFVTASFRDGSHLGSAGVTYHHDLDRFTLRAPRPQPLMVDGDYAGEYREVRFMAVRHGLRVLSAGGSGETGGPDDGGQANRACT